MPLSIVTTMARRLMLTSMAVFPLAAQIASAQEDALVYGLKFHLGYCPSPKDQLRPSDQLIGINLGKGTSFGRVELELGWFYKTGDPYVEPVGQATNPVPVSRDFSGDARRADLNGLYGRLTLHRPFLQDRLGDGFTWHAGLQLMGAKWDQQYFGDVSGGTVADSSTGNMTWQWRETYMGHARGSSLSVTPLVGLGWFSGHRGGVELNLSLLNYRSRNYVHVPGMASNYRTDLTNEDGDVVSPTADLNDCPLDSTVSKTRWVPRLELVYVYRF